MVGVGRDSCGSSSPTPLSKQYHLEQVAQDLVQEGLEYLQRRRIHNLSGQPVSVLSHSTIFLTVRHLIVQPVPKQQSRISLNSTNSQSSLIHAPWPNSIYKQSMTSMLWNISIGQLGLCSLPTSAHLLISQTCENEKTSLIS